MKSFVMLGTAVVIAGALAACGSSGSSSASSSIPQGWRKVDKCLEGYASFAGNVAYDNQNSGPGWHGSLGITTDGAGGFIANAHRFKSHQSAVAGEKGIGPPGPTVFYYGSVALEINPGTKRLDADAIKGCFSLAS